MSLNQVRVGVGLTGSFCTFAPVWEALEELKGRGAVLTCVFSYHAQQFESRFGKPEEFLSKARELSGTEPVCTIPGAEPLGPKNLLDVFLIAPCTGNTLAKLAGGITDSPVLMAAKGHLRNHKPLVIFLSSNDALGLNLCNVGTLLNTKNIYFVPFGQDEPERKPNSLLARPDQIPAALEAALRGEQVQPILLPYGEKQE
ncbi:MAG: dipicolinate synthase subunit B [Oscillospiraceae bacterium]|jgi:dipicolinate synthase subunit B|nr:dipicolinate synthase subunit B [Oscillospiraceae bacterium]